MSEVPLSGFRVEFHPYYMEGAKKGHMISLEWTGSWTTTTRLSPKSIQWIYPRFYSSYRFGGCFLIKARPLRDR